MRRAARRIRVGLRILLQGWRSDPAGAPRIGDDGCAVYWTAGDRRGRFTLMD
jgi:hypothetical protein